MKSTIEACVEFSFKGEDYALCSTIDLDHLLVRHESLPSIHAILAQDHNIDTYSYLYEVMMVSDIEFKNIQGGIAEALLLDGEFDYDLLESNWSNLRALALIRPIAADTLGITELEQHEALKDALIQAYNLGRQNSPR